MKFTASQSALLGGFLPLSGVIPSKTPLPALNHVLVDIQVKLCLEQILTPWNP